jgi:cellulose synthase/poly-beta-1,6-N-acetylglucosamine synthase-like glycosyltransferase/peptidoglycan/xylan/chitin deacetylase (PgdA/CDA1 family)/spore germination protein YaaH
MIPESGKPVFFDPDKRRWKRSVAFLRCAFALGIGLFAIFAWSLWKNPDLPDPKLPNPFALSRLHALVSPHARTDAKERVRKLPRNVRAPATRQAAHLSKLYPETLPRRDHPLVVGFFVNWDDTSLTSLSRNAGKLDILIPEWLHLSENDGGISLNDPSLQENVRRLVAEANPSLRIFPLVNNFSPDTQKWEGAKVAGILRDRTKRTRLLSALFDYVHGSGFAGINIDFESIPRENRKDFLSFVEDLAARFRSEGLLVSCSVPFDDPAFDYRGLAKHCAFLVLMAYDEHWTTGKPGPLASQSWFEEGLKKRFSELPAYKYVIALGNYGYDWPAKGHGTELSFQDALRVARESEGDIRLDRAAGNPTFSYYDENDQPHRVWFLDAVSCFNQVVAASGSRPLGFALWRLGSEDPGIWGFLGKPTPTSEDALLLSEMRYGYDLDYEGKGEVLRVTSSPRRGRRTIEYDRKSGLISDERVVSFPTPYEITRWGGGKKREVALTFDDGPDPKYTPAILDILSRTGSRATFFVIGANGNTYPSLMRRALEQGCEIGNHTFTHPDISRITAGELNLELNATERLFESRLGRKSLLFRPPYGEDVEPVTPDQIRPLLTASGLGYYTIGMQIDPKDWTNPGTERIVSSVIEGLEAGRGNVVLLHDGGGDRRQTLEALPILIGRLKELGYRTVTVSELLRLPRDAVMPPVTSNEHFLAFGTDMVFNTFQWLDLGLRILFVAGIFLGLSRMLFIGLLAIAQKLRAPAPASSAMPSVVVLIPAYNEEKVICRTVEKLLESDYGDLSVIVADDGSTDETFARLAGRFATDPRVTLITKPNGGKAAALNEALRHTTADIVITLDADTVIAPDAIGALVHRFNDPRVGAVAGNAKVGNRVNLLTRWQALEYITSQNLDRRAFDVLNCISVVPGAVGAWRRDALAVSEGFPADTLAEDADLTLAVLKAGYRIEYEERAVAWTEAPQTIRAFLKQRFRWTFGTLQVIWKHRDILFRPRYGAAGFVLIPNVLIFQIFFPLISPVMDIIPLWVAGTTLLDKIRHPSTYSVGALYTVIAFYLLFQTAEILSACLAFALERREQWTLITWMALQRFFYRQLLYIVAIASGLAAVRGGLVGWNKLERRADVSVPPTTPPAS